MSITSYSGGSLSLSIKPSYVAGSLTEIQANELSLLGTYVLAADTDIIWYVHDVNGDGSNIQIVQALGSNFQAVNNSNLLLFGTLSLAPGAMGTVVTELFTATTKLERILISGNGDAAIQILFDSSVQVSGILNRHQPNPVFELGAIVNTGTTVSVQVTGNATATADYTATLVYH